jgi:hypothetical protein
MRAKPEIRDPARDLADWAGSNQCLRSGQPRRMRVFEILFLLLSQYGQVIGFGLFWSA